MNHAVYFTYLEQSRLTCWRELAGAANPFTPVIVARAECDYHAAAHFADELDVAVAVREIGTSSFVLAYEITNAVSGRSIASGRTVLVAYDYEARRSVPLPEPTRTLLERLKL